MLKTRFMKMQAAGNDFILLDELRSPAVAAAEKSRFAAKATDRHFGVGSDGVIFVQRSARCDIRFVFFNPDGSEAEMCGNGIRCFVKYVYERGIVRKMKIQIETKSGVIVAEPVLKGNTVKEVRVDMGQPSVRRKDIPVAGPPEEKFIGQEIRVNGRTYRITAVGMGNPHAVIFTDDASKSDVAAEGRWLREHISVFPNGVNVHFVQKTGDDEFSIRTYERGVEAETLACGTGICASAVAAFLNGLADGERPMTFHALGGVLRVELAKKDGEVEKVFLTGPVEEVFSGEISV